MSTKRITAAEEAAITRGETITAPQISALEAEKAALKKRLDEIAAEEKAARAEKKAAEKAAREAKKASENAVIVTAFIEKHGAALKAAADAGHSVLIGYYMTVNGKPSTRSMRGIPRAYNVKDGVIVLDIEGRISRFSMNRIPWIA